MKVSDVINVIESTEMQTIFRQKGVFKPSISESTVQH